MDGRTDPLTPLARRSQAVCAARARWLTNWDARSGGSRLFKARITTAWEWPGEEEEEEEEEECTDKAWPVLPLSLSRTTAAHETRHSSTVSTRRLPIQVVVIAPAENRNSFHGHRTSYQVSAMRRGTAGRDETSNALGSFERDGERCR